MFRNSRLWLALARSLWAWITGLSLAALLVATPTGLQQMRINTPPEILQILELGLPLDLTILFFTTLSGIVSLIFWVIGGLIVWRKSDDWFALMISSWFFIWGVEIFVPAWIGMELLADAHPVWFWARATLLAIIDLFFFLFGYLFPNGRFVPRWAWGVALLVIILIMPGHFFPGTVLDIATWPGLFFQLLPIPVLGGMVFAQVYRYRSVSNPAERQQTKWFVYGFAALTVIQTFHFNILPMLFPDPVLQGNTYSLVLLVDFTAASLSLLLIPVSISIGILRYRLWDIDMLIRRTLIHGTLTAILGAIYLVNVIALQRILPARDEASIVFTTLLVAFLFSPLRRRIQYRIDSRFYRRKYDAGEISAAFASILRHEVDLGALSAALTQAIQETVEPEHISLWMRDIDARSPAGK